MSRFQETPALKNVDLLREFHQASLYQRRRDVALSRGYRDDLDTGCDGRACRPGAKAQVDHANLEPRGSYKFGILWAYTSPAAYQKCQKVIAKRILPIAHRYEMVARAYRGVPIMDWRSDDASGLTVEDHLARARTRAAISPTAPTPVTTRHTELAARRRRHMSISITPSSFAARDWHRMIMLCCCFCDSTKSRCSMSPETTPHWHTPHNPSEHFTSTA